MYNPPRFRNESSSAALSLIASFPFATVVSYGRFGIEVSHVPLAAVCVGEEIEIVGHFARANDHWKVLESSHTIAVFQGAHTYITPVWYASNDVPTWNYMVVHAEGQARLLESEESILECLRVLTQQAEKHWPSGWEMFVPEDLRSPMLAKYIVGFSLKVTKLEFKSKLSQNRNPQDFAGILRGLDTRTDDNSRIILEEMKKLSSK
jgi:transcriptional regulator